MEQKNCDQGVHDHDVLVDIVQMSEAGKMQTSPKLEICGENEIDIRNQRPCLRRNRLILVEKAGGGKIFFSSAVKLMETNKFTIV